MGRHFVRRVIVLVWVALLCACGGGAEPEPPRETTAGVADPATDLARRILIADTHIDVPYRLTEKMADVSVATEDGDFDYPRAVAGGLDLPFMSIYVPASYQENGGAKEFADELIAMVEGLAEANPTKFRMVHDVADVDPDDDRIGLALGMENGAPIEDDLANVAYFHERGIRYITLTHSENNQICDSSYAEEDLWGGLSEFGRSVVTEMNRVGIMVDVSHVSDETFDDVMGLSTAPVIASHSSCRHFTPGWERNMSDEMIRRLAENGGVIHINFGSSFIDDEYRLAWRARRELIRAEQEELGLDRESEEGQAFAAEYRAERPIPVADIKQVADHIDHVVELVGVEHVGIGSDYDGVGDSLPTGLEDVSTFPNLIRELLARGYSEAEIEKICSGNLLRVWRDVERVAAQSG